MKTALSWIFALSLCAVAVLIWSLFEKRNEVTNTALDTSPPIEGSIPSFESATAWINSEPLTDADLRGKVVLVNFWTYTCINWRRQLPYVRAWSEKYKEKGLVVVGVHTPEFGFEKSIDNVKWAARTMDVNYPIAVDNEYGIWGAFENRYWPALYFVDTRGNIRHHQFGEGEYEKSEEVIQLLLRESGAEIENGLVSISSSGAEAAPDWQSLGSPELYLGYDRTTSFSSPEGIELNTAQLYAFPDSLRLNHWALSGTWTVGRGASTLQDSSGKVRIRFQARDVHLVMGPSSSGKPIRFRVLVDGQPPGADHGVDVDEQGAGTVIEPRMYQLIRQTKPVVERTFEVEFFDSGVEIFSFTYG
jgi:thiol-disulfide isomerase/thioredoxin